VTFCALAREHYPRVRLALLEAPFASLEDNCQLLWGWRLAPLLYRLGMRLLAPQHDADFAASPAAHVDLLPRGVPLAFVASRADRVVHADTVKRLALLCAARRANDVYLLTLQRAAHGEFSTTDCEEDRRQYLCFVHALYERYGLPHIAEHAEHGRALLDSHTLYLNGSAD
jgi:hypothetical protein